MIVMRIWLSSQEDFNKMFKRSQFSRRQRSRNFGKTKELNKDPIICFECKKPGNMKIDYLKFKKDSRRDKRNSKEIF